MIICIDLDGTYTRDPILWSAFIRLAKGSGYTVIAATMRRPKEECPGLMLLKREVEAVYFTCRNAKAEYLERKGIYPDIWIDDSPYWILNDADG